MPVLGFGRSIDGSAIDLSPVCSELLFRCVESRVWGGGIELPTRHVNEHSVFHSDDSVPRCGHGSWRRKAGRHAVTTYPNGARRDAASVELLDEVIRGDAALVVGTYGISEPRSATEKVRDRRVHAYRMEPGSEGI